MAEAQTEKDTETESPKVGLRSETTYPFHPLGEALRVAMAVREKGGNEATEGEVMEAMGLASKTARSWTYRLSSAREFGLVVRAGRSEDARIRVTDLAKRILMPEGDVDLRAAKMQAFLTPKLYKQLFERYKGAPSPTAEGLKNLLTRHYGVLDSVGLPAAEAFLASARDAGALAGDHLVKASADAPVADAGEKGTPSADPPVVHPSTPKNQTVLVPSDFILHQFQLRKDLKLVVPLPPDLAHADVKRLHRWMTTLPLEDPPADSADTF